MSLRSSSARTGRPLRDRSRAIVKTVRYRFATLCVTVAIARLFVGDVGEALTIGTVADPVRTETENARERPWDHSQWGARATGASGARNGR